MQWRSTTKPPRSVIEGLRLRPGERVLAAARSVSEEWYVGTNLALHLPVEGRHSRLGWEDVERADWRGETEELAVVEATPFGEPERVTVVRLTEPARLLDLLRERVTSSVVCKVYAPVRGRAG